MPTSSLHTEPPARKSADHIGAVQFPDPAAEGRTVSATSPRRAYLARRLLEVLQGYRGLARTIPARDLEVVLGVQHNPDPARMIQELVNELIDKGEPIGSVNFARGGGYFLVTSEVELARCVHNYESRARENLRKAERLTQAFRHGPAQPSLTFGS